MTICPPKDSNTALYYDLVKAGNKTLSDRDRTTLKEVASQTLLVQSHMEYVKNISILTHMGNMDQVLQGFHALPKPYNPGYQIKFWNNNGTITSPWFKGDYVEEYYKEDREFHLVLELPEEIAYQVGSGSLKVKLEVDTREEPGWIEEVTMIRHTLHKSEKSWLDAEQECQSKGGHLASVSSEEVNEIVESVASKSTYVWLGGRKKSGKWGWSDNSTWGFANWVWGNEDENAEDGSCVYMNFYGKWDDRSPKHKHRFICQQNLVFKGKKRIEMTYSKDQLNVPSLSIRYKFKAVSQQMLDSWKDKRMTGFSFSWTMPTLTWTTTIRKLGRSIRTPPLIEAVNRASSEHVYKATLTIPKDPQPQFENQKLVIQLDIDKRKSDLANAFTSFKLYKRNKNWNEAEAYCEKRGGHLASIHSKWEQILAEQAADVEQVWLGGKKNIREDQWHWTDNTTWNFANWNSRHQIKNEYLMMKKNGQWESYVDSLRRYFLCQGMSTIFTQNGLVSIDLDKEQFDDLPYHVLYRRRPFNHTSINHLTENKRNFSGFTLNWFATNRNSTISSEKPPTSHEDWVQEIPFPEYRQPLLDKMVQLARHFRVAYNMTEEQILYHVVREKIHNISILNEKEMCSMDQVKPEHLDKVFLKLVSIPHNEDSLEAATDNDIRTGFELFHAIIFCPTLKIQLFQFVDKLLSSESSRTILQAIVNLFRSKIIKDHKSISLMKDFYAVLSSTLDLQFGNILLAMSTKSQLHEAIDNDWPFFGNKTELVKSCLFDSKCEGLEVTIRNLG